MPARLATLWVFFLAAVPLAVCAQALNRWQLECRPSGFCEARYHLPIASEEAVATARMVLTDDRQSPAKVIWLVPLGVELPARLAVRIDSRKPVKLPYYACLQIGCQAVWELSPADLWALRSGKRFSLTMLSAIDGNTVVATGTLIGVAEVYQALKARQASE